MRRTLFLFVAVAGVASLSGCTWETVRQSIFGSLYNRYGDGYGGDRFTDFDDRYEQQSRAAADYYEQQRQ